MAGATVDGTKKEIRIQTEDTHTTPAAGEVAVYPKADKKLYIKDDAGLETKLTATGAPDDATYITQIANGSLSNEQALSTLATGDIGVTTGTGVLGSFKSNLNASVAPTANDDSGSGYVIGSRWIDTTANKSYQCVDATVAAAVWNELSAGGSTVIYSQARLTLSSTLPVMTTDTVGTILYLLPFGGNQYSVYDGADWQTFTLGSSGININTSGLSIDTNYDVYVTNHTSPALELTAWTNDTTRATALVLQDGFYVKSGATTRRYVGTIRTYDSGGATVGFAHQPNGGVSQSRPARLFVWNCYNRMGVTALVTDSTNSWTYSSATWRQMNNNTNNQIDVVAGLQEEPVTIQNTALVLPTAGNFGAIGIGVSSTTVASQNINYDPGGTGVQTFQSAFYIAMATIGKISYTAIEQVGAGTVTFYGDNGATIPKSGPIGGFKY
jgi:hypothetical protein